MKVCIFSNNKTLAQHFSRQTSRSPFRIDFHKYEELRNVLKNHAGPAIVYLDIKSKNKTYKKDLDYLLKKDCIYPAVLDPGGIIDDIGVLFLNGVVDYLAGTSINKLFDEKRLKAVLAYLETFRGDYEKPASGESAQAISKSACYITANNWQEIQTGKEYTFTLLYIEFDNKEELIKKHDKAQLSQALVIFKNYIERNTLPYNGRIWIWNDFGGIVLFPFTGGKCPGVFSAFKIMLYKFLHDVEESIFPHFISFRMALHMGNLVYQKQETGSIISDTINSTFHLGKIFTEAGHMTITEDILMYTPDPLKKFFKPAGKFENHLIYKVRRPLFLVAD